MHGFDFSPDIVIRLKKVTTPIIKPMVFKKEHTEMVSKKTKEIMDDINDNEVG